MPQAFEGAAADSDEGPIAQGRRGNLTLMMSSELGQMTPGLATRIAKCYGNLSMIAGNGHTSVGRKDNAVVIFCHPRVGVVSVLCLALARWHSPIAFGMALEVHPNPFQGAAAPIY